MAQPRVALIGLGLMGSGMALYNRNPERAAPLAAERAPAASPRDAASGWL